MARRSALIPAHRAEQASQIVEEAIGCRGLWAAVLWLAVYDLSGSRRRSLMAPEKSSADQRKARDYLLSDRYAVGSAWWICDILDIEFRAFQMRCMTAEGRARILKRVGDLAAPTLTEIE